MAKTVGRVTRKPARIRITNIHMGGDYTGIITVGAKRLTANVILDTGSSTLALDGKFYDPNLDPTARLTDMVQEVTYGSGHWIGAVVQSDISVGNADVPQVSVAATYVESKNMFGNADGILGLAYTALNNAFILPGVTWPPSYHYNQIQDGRITFLRPYFTQLEQVGIFANRFAFYTKRSMVSNALADPAADPLNQGYLILGGGEEATDLYDRSKPFLSVRVLADSWYSTNLKAIVVGNSAPIMVPPPTKGSSNLTNSIIDSGTNRLILNQDLFNGVVDRFSRVNPSYAQALRAGYVDMSDLNRKLWPNLTFVMEGVAGDVKLTVAPQAYWQVNAPERGIATAPLLGDHGQLKGRSILGLPLMNGYFTIFDRSADRLGTVKFAPRL